MSKRRPWSPADVDVVRGLRQRGLSLAKIAPRLGRSRNSVVGIVHRRKETMPPSQLGPNQRLGTADGIPQ
jgi:hypothetical protein